MAIILLMFGSALGLGAAVLQWTLQDASLVEGVITYFGFGFGFPLGVGLLKWIEMRLRLLFDLHQPPARDRSDHPRLSAPLSEARVAKP